MIRTSVVAVVALSSLAAVACAAPSIDTPEGADTASAPAPAPSAPPAGGATGGGTGMGGGAAPSSTPADPPMAKHCNLSPVLPDLCAENAQGRAGDVVEVEVYLLGNATCTEAWEVSGHLLLDLSRFELVNEVEQIDCRTRKIGPGLSGGDEIQWNVFGGGAIASCPNNVPAGKVDKIQLRIRPNTPPGDYVVAWDMAAVPAAANAPPTCASFGGGLPATIRVLPSR